MFFSQEILKTLSHIIQAYVLLFIFIQRQVLFFVMLGLGISLFIWILFQISKICLKSLAIKILERYATHEIFPEKEYFHRHVVCDIERI